MNECMEQGASAAVDVDFEKRIESEIRAWTGHETDFESESESETETETESESESETETDVTTRCGTGPVPMRQTSQTIATLELRTRATGEFERASPMSSAEHRTPVAAPDWSSVRVIDIDLDELLASIETAIGETGKLYFFGNCALNTAARSLTCSGRSVHLRPKVYRLLVHLLEQRHRAVSRDELGDVLWNGRCVGNATVDSTVKALRSAVGDDGSMQWVVRTLSGYGYQFVAPVKLRTAAGAVTSVQRLGATMNLDVRFHTALLDGVYSEHRHLST